jgi:hypothetical protein
VTDPESGYEFRLPFDEEFAHAFPDVVAAQGKRMEELASRCVAHGREPAMRKHVLFTHMRQNQAANSEAGGRAGCRARCADAADALAGAGGPRRRWTGVSRRCDVPVGCLLRAGQPAIRAPP